MNTDQNLEIIKIPGAGSFQFSAIRLEDLGATEYTLVTIVVDITGSVASFADDLLKMVKSVIEACKKSPRAENLLIRLVTFNYYNNIQEVHGFKLLSLIDLNSYKNFICTGMTALFDASYESVGATLTFSKSLIDQDYNCNGCIYIITDGADNNSKVATKKMIKDKIIESMKSETIESLITVLIGINAAECKTELDEFKNQANLTQFVDVGEATPQKLAKLAAFVSKSISSTSQALGTGAPSQPLTF